MHFLKGMHANNHGQKVYFLQVPLHIHIFTSEVVYNNSGQSDNNYSALGKVYVLKTEGQDGQIELFIALLN